jgi:hypothetical protein
LRAGRRRRADDPLFLELLKRSGRRLAHGKDLCHLFASEGDHDPLSFLDLLEDLIQLRPDFLKVITSVSAGSLTPA